MTFAAWPFAMGVIAGIFATLLAQFVWELVHGSAEERRMKEREVRALEKVANRLPRRKG